MNHLNFKLLGLTSFKCGKTSPNFALDFELRRIALFIQKLTQLNHPIV